MDMKRNNYEVNLGYSNEKFEIDIETKRKSNTVHLEMNEAFDIARNRNKSGRKSKEISFDFKYFIPKSDGRKHTNNQELDGGRRTSTAKDRIYIQGLEN